uniref:Uncharacterized protein n=1 Tax=Lepeophtheirus salmonis TaxID=72036 RepID=A0A0K2TR12_LEPSM
MREFTSISQVNIGLVIGYIFMYKDNDGFSQGRIIIKITYSSLGLLFLLSFNASPTNVIKEDR